MNSSGTILEALAVLRGTFGDQVGLALATAFASVLLAVSATVWAIRRLRAMAVEVGKLFDALRDGVEKWRLFRNSLRATKTHQPKPAKKR